MAREELKLEGGKYTLVSDSGRITAYRNGLDWQDLTGNKLVGTMFDEIVRLRAVVDYAHAQATGFVSENMAQCLAAIAQVTDPKDQL